MPDEAHSLPKIKRVRTLSSAHPDIAKGKYTVTNMPGVHLPRHPVRKPGSPTHSGPPSQSLVITTHVPPILVRLPSGVVRSWTRHEVARALGVTPATTSLLFSGQRSLTMSRAIQISTLFGCSLDQLVNEILPATIVRVTEHRNNVRANLLADSGKGKV